MLIPRIVTPIKITKQSPIVPIMLVNTVNE